MIPRKEKVLSGNIPQEVLESFDEIAGAIKDSIPEAQLKLNPGRSEGNFRIVVSGADAYDVRNAVHDRVTQLRNEGGPAFYFDRE